METMQELKKVKESQTTATWKKIGDFVKKEPMPVISVMAALLSFLITPPSVKLLSGIEWHTLATLFMMLTVLEGFKSENIFRPLLKLAGSISSMVALSLFLVFSVFFSSMFVTNDVALIIFVPLTIMLFRAGDKEPFILPVIVMENIAAIRGSLLMPFGSPHNLFIYGKSGVSAAKFVKFMLPIWLLSAALLIVFVLLLYRRNLRQRTGVKDLSFAGEWDGERKFHRIAYITVFAVVLWAIVSRSSLWPLVAVGVAAAVFFIDRRILFKTDYLLLLTFFCFFIFVREYPGKGGKFLKTFMLICLMFFAIVAVPGYFLSLSGI